MTNQSTGTSGSATDVVVSRIAGTGTATWANVARWLDLAPRYGLRVVGPPIPETEA
jgi:hypothetical protein